jgi:hypothetical protein
VILAFVGERYFLIVTQLVLPIHAPADPAPPVDPTTAPVTSCLCLRVYAQVEQIITNHITYNLRNSQAFTYNLII